MPSALSAKLSHLFNSGVRSRGQVYFNRRLVRLKSGNAASVEAVVAGSLDYQTQIECKDEEVNLACTCPYFESDGPCKHLWATVLAAQQRGFVSALNWAVHLPPSPHKETFEPLSLKDEIFRASMARRPVAQVSKPQPRPVTQKIPAWKDRISGIGKDSGLPSREWPKKREIVYIVDRPASFATGCLVLAIQTHDLKLNGTYSRLNPLSLERGRISSLPVESDREILALIAGAGEYHAFGGSYAGIYSQAPTICTLRSPLSRMVLPLAIRTGRCCLRKGSEAEELEPLSWDEAGPWRFALQLRPKSKGRNPNWQVTGDLRRGADELMEASALTLVTQGGEWFSGGKAGLLEDDTALPWLLQLRRSGPIETPAEDLDDLLETLLCTPGIPPVTVPDEIVWEEIAATPRPCITVNQPSSSPSANSRLDADLHFDYGGWLVPEADSSTGFYDAEARRFTRRDKAAEAAAKVLLTEEGFRPRPASYYATEPAWELPPAKLPHTSARLLEAGWGVEVDGNVFRRAEAFRIDVSSGLDWFELNGVVDYGETSAKIPELLEALRRGENTVRLDDGAYGVLPDDWLRKIGMVAGMGTAKDGRIRFRPGQAGLLDALLAAQPDVTFDAGFSKARDELRQFRSVEPGIQPGGFVGQLRDYQLEGLGWMNFLRRFSFGGCLADDMGTGKTAQALALLEDRRRLRSEGQVSGPSLVVVPRSLLFNWKREAERFTPAMRVVNYAGLKRDAAAFADYDLILITYGTLRRDVARLKDVEFDYIVLDEAQAIKNAATESAKAARLLKGAHRLALSGTPVENHIGELWSLFEFLNPGMLGSASVFKNVTGSGRALAEETRAILSSALRPFILRRTKEQVAKELPARTEQTVYCELEPPQRKLYDELRRHYRDSLLNRITTDGMAKSKIMVLEALLRLRQAACHPGLIDVKRAGEPSAKLEALREQLREVLDAGHKALVFSQFTTLLKIVRKQLDDEGVAYEYLDGRTVNREACVERFQGDPACRLFLISLKAGGLGLNLTAADYVFLLDPWWNPAVEAQAVDRAHRIGQTRNVFAYRLIARDTVEEKVLELQKSKRDLAAAIIGEDNSLIRNLRREDLELLLS